MCQFATSERNVLQLRPLLELKETLLHEMIHAYIFLLRIRDGDHGPKFQERMHLINRSTFPDSQVQHDLQRSSCFSSVC